MINIYILDDNFQIIHSPIDNFNSLLWNRDYYEAGNFQLTCDAEYMELLLEGRYIYKSDSDDMGIIESVEYTKNDSSVEKVVAKGRFLLAKLCNHVVAANLNVGGTVEYIISELVRQYNTSLPVTMRQYKGLGDNVQAQVSYENLYDVVTRLCKAYHISCKIQYDFHQDKLFFEVWEGLNRTEGQYDNNPAIFSEKLDNLLTSRYCRDVTGYKNYAYVGGEGDIITRHVAELDMTDGQERREIFINASHIKRGDQSLANYNSQLLAYGREVLAEHYAVHTVDSSVSADGSLVYKQDFDLGDVCTIINPRAGLDFDIRITKINEIYENNTFKISVNFGNEEMSLRKLIKLR